MTNKQRVQQILRFLDLKSDKNLEWVILHLEALLDSTYQKK
jgi:hypothetical protein